MLDNTFTEDYYRVENTIDTNKQSFTRDNEGRLIFTTPFFLNDEILTTTFLNTDQNIQPENVNLIVDQITLLSTNPDVNNYLPIKISLGQKQQIEFGQVTVVPMENYKVVVQPPINLVNITNHHYEDELVTTFTQPAPINIISRVVNHKDQVWVVHGLLDELLRFDLTGKTSVSVPYVGAFVEIFANDYQSALVVFSAGSILLIDLLTNNITNATASRPAITLLSIVNVFIFKDILIITYNETGVTKAVYYSKNANGYTSFYENNLSLFSPQVDFVCLNNTNILAGYDVTTNIVTVIRILSNRIDPQTLFRFEIRPVTGVVRDIFLGGIPEKPILSIFSYNGTTLYWNTYKTEDLQNGPSVLEPFTQVNFLVNGPFKLKSYLNHVFVSARNTSEVYLFNLDTGDYLQYNLNDIDPNNPPYQEVSVVAYSPGYAIYTSIGAGLNKIHLNYFRNTRNINEIYQLSFNYVERTFQYTLDGRQFKFNIRVANEDLFRDLEIFKYIIDLRIRYTKTKRIVNPLTRNKAMSDSTTQGVDTLNTRRPFVRVRRSDKGDEAEDTAARVLGYVDEDFSVSDFLNIYVA